MEVLGYAFNSNLNYTGYAKVFLKSIALFFIMEVLGYALIRLYSPAQQEFCTDKWAPFGRPHNMHWLSLPWYRRVGPPASRVTMPTPQLIKLHSRIKSLIGGTLVHKSSILVVVNLFALAFFTTANTGVNRNTFSTCR